VCKFDEKALLPLDFFSFLCYNRGMKTENQQNQIFPIKLSKLVIALSIACIALCIAGIGVTIYRIILIGGLHDVSDYLKYPLLILVCIFCIVVVVSILVRSHYAVEDKKLITRIGIVKSTYEIKDFTALTLDLKTDKLSIYQGKEFFVLKLQKAWKDDFIRALLTVKPSLEVTYDFADDEPEEKEDKKDKK